MSRHHLSVSTVDALIVSLEHCSHRARALRLCLATLDDVEHDLPPTVNVVDHRPAIAVDPPTELAAYVRHTHPRRVL